QLAEQLAPRSAELLGNVVRAYRKLLPTLETAATEYTISALRQLKVAWEPGRRLSLARFADEGGIVAPQRRLAGRLLELRGEEGLLHRIGADWEIVRPLPAVDPEARLARLVLEHPETQVEVTLLGRCGAQLAAVLRGACEPL